MAQLKVYSYHYVRDVAGTRFPDLKGLGVDEFRRQVDLLASTCEMASLDSMLEFLAGRYQPKRDLCLLTFDDGLMEHYTTVTPMLAERRIPGLFFIITMCQQEARVASVHMNHFLMARGDFEGYERAFLKRLGEMVPDLDPASIVNQTEAARTYCYDSPNVARFKYLFNFALSADTRDAVVTSLFSDMVAPEKEFSKQLYFSWEQARQMQAAGMILGGHTHRHRPLSMMSDAELGEDDLGLSRRLLDAAITPQAWMPFSFPYGKRDSFDHRSVPALERSGFVCAFTMESGANAPGTAPHQLLRFDCKVLSA